MQEKTWYDYFDEDPYEQIGRFVKGAFGEDISVIMPRISWAYLDWLEQNEKISLRLFFEDVEKVRTENHGNMHEVYQATIHHNFLKREKEKLPRPEWCEPAEPEDLLDL